MIINLTFAELEIVKGFDMTFVCGPVGYAKKAGIPKKSRKEIGKIIGWFLDNFFAPVREENKALLKGETRRAALLAISKDFDLPFRWIQRIYELLDAGLLTLAQDEGVYYELKLFCNDHELPEMRECHAKFKKAIESVKRN